MSSTKTQDSGNLLRTSFVVHGINVAFNLICFCMRIVVVHTLCATSGLLFCESSKGNSKK